MTRIRFVFTLFALGFFASLRGQSTYITNLNDVDHLVDRMEIKAGRIFPCLYTNVKPFERKAVMQLLDSLPADMPLSPADRFNLAYVRSDNPEWMDHMDTTGSGPVLKYFYQQKAALYSVKIKDFDLLINPVLSFIGGMEKGSDELLYQNTRGVEVRGLIANTIGFYSFISENQMSFPEYMDRRIDSAHAIPGEGLYKPFKKDGYDFFQARGYITFPATKYIQFQFGNDRNFIGNGIRSLILSDACKDYLFLKANLKIWKFNYENLFMELTNSSQSQAHLYGKKYMAFHHLSFNLGRNVNIGLFESVVFARGDSARRNGFEFSYLNPVIFYRSAEQNQNSGDNALLGMDMKWNFAKRWSVYGQVVLDEFNLENMRAMNGWWGNKQAYQAGFKHMDLFGVQNLDIQGEFNYVRPFTYTHFRADQNYINFNQPLAHPEGANFQEIVASIRYQPTGRLTATARFFYLMQGKDTAYLHKIGENILWDYNQRLQEYNNKVGQGAKYNVLYAELQLTWMPFHNGFIDLRYIYRKADSNLDILKSNTQMVSVGFRMNITPRPFNF